MVLNYSKSILLNNSSNSFTFMSPLSVIGSHLNSGKLSIFFIFFDVFGINGAIKFEMFAIIYAHVYVILLNSSMFSFAFFHGSFSS